MKTENTKEFLDALHEQYQTDLARGLAGIAGDMYLSALSDIRWLRERRAIATEENMPVSLEVGILDKAIESIFNLLGAADILEEEAAEIKVH